MSQNNIEGEFTVTGDGEVVLTTAPFPVVGTVTIDFNVASLSADVVPKIRGRNAGAVSAKGCIYQRSNSNTDIAADVPLDDTTDGIYYVRLDGTRLSLVTTNYVSGSASGTWSWSQG